MAALAGANSATQGLPAKRLLYRRPSRFGNASQIRRAHRCVIEWGPVDNAKVPPALVGQAPVLSVDKSSSRSSRVKRKAVRYGPP